MASTSETGHAKNVANFQDLIEFVTGYGANYDPSKSSLKLSSLTNLYTSAQAKLADVVTKNTAYNSVVNERVMAFDGLKSLSTRLVSALDATDASPETIKDAETLNRKLQGKRASTPALSEDPNTLVPTTISVSQQSYDQLIQHFAGLISVLESEPSYQPNENDLKITALNAKKDDLVTKNAKVATFYATVSNSRIERNKTLYTSDTGLVEIAGDVKSYVKSIYGATSPEYAQIKGIQFKSNKS